MKKAIVLLLTLVLVFSLCACGNDISLNKQDNDLVAEYVAGVMLKYSRDNIYNYRQLKNEQNKQEEPTKGGSSQGNNNLHTNPAGSSGNAGGSGSQSGSSGGQNYVADVMGQLAKDLNLNGATIVYHSYAAGDFYSPDGILSVPASAGCKVFSFRFLIQNDTGEQIMVNTNSSSVRFKLSVGGRTIAQSATILANDLNSLKNVVITVGGSYEGVVIFQVPNEAAADLSDMSLLVFSGGVEIGKVPGVAR